MRPQIIVPLSLFLLAGLLGWALLFRTPGAEAPPASALEPEPTLAAPAVRPAPEPARRRAEATAPTPASGEKADRERARPGASTPEPGPDAPRQLPNSIPRERILQLPEHLREASPEKQRGYYEHLVSYHERAVARASDDLQKTLALAEEDEQQAARVEHLRTYIERAEAQLRVLSDHLDSLDSGN